MKAVGKLFKVFFFFADEPEASLIGKIKSKKKKKKKTPLRYFIKHYHYHKC